MATMNVVLERFDASKAKVRKEIREGFFHSDGSLRISEADVRTWIADRAVDELKVVFQLCAVLAKSAHLIPAHLLVQVTEQLSDEARHFDILRSLVPAELHSTIDAKVAALPAMLAAEEHWSSLMAAVEVGNPFAALLDINVVHEGYSAAAIEELTNIPFEDIQEAYSAIGADEEKHHESGRELLEWLARASESSGETGSLLDSVTDRAVDGAAMSWSWPSQQPPQLIEHAHERAVEGGAMSWSWPAAAPSVTGRA